MRRLPGLLLLVVGIGVAGGCSKDASEPQPGASQGNEAPPVPATGTVPLTKLSDGQIAAILTTVDDAEIEQAQVALQHATNPEVRAFATHMVEQHTAAKQAGAQLAAQAALKPVESPKSQELQAAGAQTLARLKAADHANFDITYLSAQIEQHAEVLKLIEDQLLPAVNAPALRDHLSTARGMVQQHLDEARRIQK
jgi:putative membrane protein